MNIKLQETGFWDLTFFYNVCPRLFTAISLRYVLPELLQYVGLKTSVHL